MTALPRSLRGRTLLLTVIGIFACELVTFAVLGAYRHALFSGRSRDFVSGQVEMVRAALTHASPQQVANELERQHGHRGLLGKPRLDGNPSFAEPPSQGGADRAPPMDRGGPPFGAPPPDRERRLPPFDDSAFGRGGGVPTGPMSRMRLIQTLPEGASSEFPADSAIEQVVNALREEYGDDALRYTEMPESAVWVRVSPDGWWLMFPFARYTSPPIPWFVVLSTLAAVAVMGGLVGLYSFHLSRPLRALADAAANYQIGKHPQLPLTGPDEIQAVTAQFNAMAERLERDEAERRVMLAGLPHDLRAPLARAKLRLELMDDGPDSPKAGLARDLAEVGSIADQFVAYLRGLDHDTHRFEARPLQELVRDRGLVWRESGHDVTITRTDPFTRGVDVDALTRAIDNLIGNAFAHGGAPVRIAGERSGEGKKAHYRIVVRDRGPGIPPAQRAEALKPFTRLDAARGASGHCGLGLAVVQSVARLHGGQVELEEAEGGGLAAAIALPADAPGTPASAGATAPSSPSGDRTARDKARRVARG